MILTEKFPTAVRVNGEVYDVNADFRVGLKIMEAFESPKLARHEKQYVMIALLFPKRPPDFFAASAAAIKFLDCGRQKTNSSTGRVFSFTKDADFIYSAFLQTYGVDLQTASLHWWAFTRMFADLSPDTTFERIVSLRVKQQRGLLSKEEQRVWMEAHEVLELEQEHPDAELLAAREHFDRLLGG